MARRQWAFSKCGEWPGKLQNLPEQSRGQMCVSASTLRPGRPSWAAQGLTH